MFFSSSESPPPPHPHPVAIHRSPSLVCLFVFGGGGWYQADSPYVHVKRGMVLRAFIIIRSYNKYNNQLLVSSFPPPPPLFSNFSFFFFFFERGGGVGGGGRLFSFFSLGCIQTYDSPLFLLYCLIYLCCFSLLLLFVFLCLFVCLFAFFLL